MKIILIGELDLDLTRRGIKAGEFHDAKIDKKGSAHFFDKRIDDKYTALVYPQNFIALNSHEDYQNAISTFSKKMVAVESRLPHIKDKELRQHQSKKRTYYRKIIEKLQIEYGGFCEKEIKELV